MDSEITPNHFILSIRHELESVRVFRVGRRGEQVRSEFADLHCEQCGKIDEWTVLHRGIPDEVRVKQPLDFANSGEGMVIVSRKVVEILTNAAGNDVTFFPFQTGEYAVLWPLKTIEVDAKSPLNRKRHTPNQPVALRNIRCSNCDRPGMVTVRPEFGNYADDDKIVGLRAEGRGVNFMLVAHNQIGDLLKDGKVAGWRREKIVPFAY